MPPLPFSRGRGRPLPGVGGTQLRPAMCENFHMRTKNVTGPSPRPVSTTPETAASKALPPERKNEVVPQRSKDSFESAPTRARPAASQARLTGSDPGLQRPAGNGHHARVPSTPRTSSRADWTCFVHLNADNNLEEFGKADLNEMEAVGSLEGKMNVIALVDGGTMKEADGWQTGAPAHVRDEGPEQLQQDRLAGDRRGPQVGPGQAAGPGQGGDRLGQPPGAARRHGLRAAQRRVQALHGGPVGPRQRLARRLVR